MEVKVNAAKCLPLSYISILTTFLIADWLKQASKGRTTIVIAHRLSTIRNADKIVSISQGRKREEGVHEELMELGGLYSQLVKIQVMSKEACEPVWPNGKAVSW